MKNLTRFTFALTVTLAATAALLPSQAYAQGAAPGTQAAVRPQLKPPSGNIGRASVADNVKDWPNVPPSPQLFPKPFAFQWYLDFDGKYRFMVSPQKQADMRVNLDVDAQEAWTLTTGRPSVVVAMIGSGLEVNHPLLRNSVYVNSREIPGNKKDDDKNGYVDDVNGWNAVDKSGDLTDTNSMGTFLAGTIIASGAPGAELSGIAPSVQLMTIKAMTSKGATGTYKFADIIAGLDYILKAKASGVDIRVVLLSHVATDHMAKDAETQQMAKRLRQLSDAGVSIVPLLDAGNTDLDKSPFSPARIEASGVLSAMGVGFMGERSFNSDYGAQSVTVAAPNFNGLTTESLNTAETYGGSRQYQVRGEKGVVYPVTWIVSNVIPQGLLAGTAALIYSVNPSLKPSDVKNIIVQTAKVPGGPQLPKTSATEQPPAVLAKGFLDAGDAVRMAREMAVNGFLRNGIRPLGGATVEMQFVFNGKLTKLSTKADSDGFFSMVRPPVGTPFTINVYPTRPNEGIVTRSHANDVLAKPPGFVIDIASNQAPR